jgi:hypothetical protein
LWSSGNKNVATSILDTKTSSSREVSVGTLADKCVWSALEKNIVFCAVPKSIPGGTYPDDWYKGKISFSDSMWKINATTGETENVFDPAREVATPMDMINLGFDQKEKTLVFMNKKDMTVWRYDLAN